MKKYFFVHLVIVALLVVQFKSVEVSAASIESTKAESNIESMTSFDELKSLKRFIDNRIKFLKKGSKEKKNSTKRENISISSVKVSYPNGMDFGSNGNVMDQKVTVTLKNNDFGPISLDGRKIKYEIYLYEEGKKLFKAASGEAIVPYANGYSEFDAMINGGKPFDGSDREKKYKALIKIDTSNDVKESNEKDNEKSSEEWVITYYKG